MFGNHNVECISIKDIKPGLKNINVVFIILDVGPATVTKENREVRNFKVGDPSACINASIWDEPGKYLVPGDIIRLTKGYASIWRHCLTLYSGKTGDVHKIGEFCLTFNEQINMSESKLAHSTSPPIQGPTPLNNNNSNNNNNNNNNGNTNNGSAIQPHRVVPTPVTTTANVTPTTKGAATTTRQSASTNSVNVSESSKTPITSSQPAVVAAPQPATKANRTSRSNQTRGAAKAERR